MGVLSIFSKKVRPSHTIVFDISSSSVGVAIIKNKKKVKPVHVLFCHRVPIKYKNKKDAESLGMYLGNALKEAGVDVLEAFGKINEKHATYELQAIVHYPWMQSHSKSVKGILQKEMMVTKNMLMEFMKQHVKKEKGEEDKSEQAQVNTHITQITLNGYTTDKPYNKRARTIQVSLLETSIRTTIYRSIVTTLKHVFPHHSLHLDSLIFAVLSLGDAVNDHEDFMLIDIGGEHSTATVVAESVVQEQVSFSFGTQQLIQTLTRERKMQDEQAHSELQMYLEDTGTPSQSAKIESLLVRAEKEFVTVFGDMCAQINKTRRVPTQVLLMVELNQYSKWFSAIIERIDFKQFTVTGHTLRVKLLVPEKMNPGVHFAKSLSKYKRDIFTIIALFVASKHSVEKK